MSNAELLGLVKMSVAHSLAFGKSLAWINGTANFYASQYGEAGRELFLNTLWQMTSREYT